MSGGHEFIQNKHVNCLAGWNQKGLINHSRLLMQESTVCYNEFLKAFKSLFSAFVLPKGYSPWAEPPIRLQLHAAPFTSSPDYSSLSPCLVLSRKYEFDI